MIQSPRYCTQMKKHTCHDHMIFHGCVNITANYISMGIALLVFTQQIYYHGVDVRHPSYVIRPFIRLPIIRKLRFLRNCHMDPDQIKFYGKLPIHHITRLFLSYFLQVSNFHIFFFVFINMGHYRSQNCETLLLPQITSESSQTAPKFLSPISS